MRYISLIVLTLFLAVAVFVLLHEPHSKDTKEDKEDKEDTTNKEDKDE